MKETPSVIGTNGDDLGVLLEWDSLNSLNASDDNRRNKNLAGDPTIAGFKTAPCNEILLAELIG
jgi:hypothetical protein